MKNTFMPSSKAFYAATVLEFSRTPHSLIVAELTRRTALVFRGNEIQQVQAWERQLQVLQEALVCLGGCTSDWSILLEYPLLRLGRRLDAIILARGRIVVIEFKIGARGYHASDMAQVEDYALCLRDFHIASTDREIVPILCVEMAPAHPSQKLIEFIEGVSSVQCTNASSLSDTLFATVYNSQASQIHWRDFDTAAYNPTPTIVDAAKAIYAGHAVRDIGRADASAEAIEITASRLEDISREAKALGRKKVCFVTGTPGSGKTLLGLNLVFAHPDASGYEPAALLSGNRPLVHVIQEALAEDAASRHGSKKESRRRAQAALQNLLGYLKEHSGDEAKQPPEHVIVYDEAQRAWDEDTGRKLLGRPKSEPALFLEIMSRLPWACLVCLLGPGQEINRGEGGLPLWGVALEEAARAGIDWDVHVSPVAAVGNPDLVGQSLLNNVTLGALPVQEEPSLHLSAGVRAYRNETHGLWVEALLAGRLAQAAEIASGCAEPPATVTRDLPKLRARLKSLARGTRRVGLLASSGATRLVGEGIPPSPRSNELDRIAHWFLRPPEDFRSSNALETPLSEFVCQGLEVDYAGLCWGGDLIWDDEGWVPRAMSAPKWHIIRKDEKRLYRMNAYRVLLTRARAGLIIWVPLGNEGDPTRLPTEMERVAATLLAAGCKPL